MKRISTTLLITLSLVGIVVSAVFVANVIGIFPSADQAIAEGRIALCESIGIHCSQAVARRDAKMIKESLDVLVERNDDMLAIRLQKGNGETLSSAGEESYFRGDRAEIAVIPILANAVDWGTVEVAFSRKTPHSLLSLLTAPVSRLALVLGGLCGIVFQFYLKRILQHLDPTRVVPERVRTTLDTLAEGLVVLDQDHRIVLANQAFADTMCCDAEELQGVDIAEFSWKLPNTVGVPERMPWAEAIETKRIVAGSVLQLDVPNVKSRKFRLSCSPIMNNDEDCQGALVSFDDVTALEARTVELTSMLEKLRESRDKIRLQNQQLVTLATRDPLTGAFNRRSLFERLDKLWERAAQDNAPLCFIMLDIDNFKLVNDSHGHTKGDVVLKQAVQILHDLARSRDVVGRFGGEEFCVVIPNADLAEAVRRAEKIRAVFEQFDFSGLSITASLGVAQMTSETGLPQDLIEYADRSLYVAKRTGRNRVIAFPDLERLEELEAVEKKASDGTVVSLEKQPAIPFQTVAALTAALAYRDIGTAQHSRRVADHCFKLGSELMTISESYILENAALLHDIGKIGVPDCVLLKPGPLTDKEWEIMKTHDRIGVEIIRSTFACDELNNIVESHHARYSATDDERKLPSGKDIPLGARILTIADSYDAMVSDRVYRKGCTQESAFAELQRCSGTQFDPDLVKMFIEMILKNEVEVVSNSASSALAPVDKQTALRLGIQIEDLAQALDNQDRERLVSIAAAIAETATQHGVPEVVKLASELQQAATNDEEWIEYLGLTIELMELCRLTQQTHLSVNRNSGDVTSEKRGVPHVAIDAQEISVAELQGAS